MRFIVLPVLLLAIASLGSSYELESVELSLDEKPNVDDAVKSALKFLDTLNFYLKKIRNQLFSEGRIKEVRRIEMNRFPIITSTRYHLPNSIRFAFKNQQYWNDTQGFGEYETENEAEYEVECSTHGPRPHPTHGPRPHPTHGPRPHPTHGPRPHPTGRPGPPPPPFPTDRPGPQPPFPTGRPGPPPPPFPTDRPGPPPPPFPTDRPGPQPPFPTGRPGPPPPPFPTDRPGPQPPFPTGRPGPPPPPFPTDRPGPQPPPFPTDRPGPPPPPFPTDRPGPQPPFPTGRPENFEEFCATTESPADWAEKVLKALDRFGALLQKIESGLYKDGYLSESREAKVQKLIVTDEVKPTIATTFSLFKEYRNYL